MAKPVSVALTRVTHADNGEYSELELFGCPVSGYQVYWHGGCNLGDTPDDFWTLSLDEAWKVYTEQLRLFREFEKNPF